LPTFENKENLMAHVHLLILDSGPGYVTPFHELESRGVNLEVTSLDSDEIARPFGYVFSPRARELAQRAADYDFVIVGNNQGSGLAYANAIPAEMRPRTLIVWNDYEPGDETDYAALGYEHVASRRDERAWLLGLVKETREAVREQGADA
jgi:hypothetical protein